MDEAAKLVESSEALQTPARVRVYTWQPDSVAAFLESQGDLAQYAPSVRFLQISGAQLMGCDDAQIRTLLNCTARHAHDINSALKTIRSAEVAEAPRPSSQVAAKIESAKKGATLNLNEMKISRFPDAICDLMQISSLSIVGNKLKTIPPEIGLMTRLVSLKCGSNKLISLPESLGCLRNLQLLLLEENELASIPETIMYCTALKTLDISQNRLEMLPSGLYQCTKLSKLNLYDNPLRIPQDLITKGVKVILKLLEALHHAASNSVDVSNMSLASIPVLLLGLCNLTVLNLDDNLLNQIHGIHLLSNLTHLSFKNNSISKLPLDLHLLTSLRFIRCEANPLYFPPYHVIDLGASSLLRYLRAHVQIFSERVRDFFDAFDEDGSGTVNRKEFISSLDKISFKFRQDEILQLVNESDADGDGSISSTEFTELLMNALQQRREESLFNDILDLSHIALAEYGAELSGAGEVSSLLLHHNRLKTLPLEMASFSNLASLDLGFNALAEIPHAISALTTLRVLSLRDNLLKIIPDWFVSSGSFSKLETLYLENNKLTYLPCDLVRLECLKHLGLTGNPLRSPLQNVLQEGSNFVMAYLNLFYNSKHSGLLDLSGLNFAKIPDEADFSQILTCLLCKNRLQELPTTLHLARSLKALDLSDNEMDQIPDDFLVTWTSLRELYVSRNRIEILGRSISFLQLLQSLHLDSNMLTALPNTLSTLSSLSILDLKNNRLSDFPATLSALPAIKELHIGNNKLKSLPENIRCMTSLQRLWVRGNEICKLPDVFDFLSLVLFDVANNPLEALPLSLGTLNTSMQELLIDRNLHLEDPPDVLICRGTKLLLTYLKRQYDAVKSQVLNLSSLAMSQLTVPLRTIDLLCNGILTLDLSTNSFHELPRSVGMCAFVKTLILKNNFLAELPPSTKQMKTLTHLDISGNLFVGVPELLSYTPNIRDLDLSSNKISSFYRNIDHVASGGFDDALHMTKRARDRQKYGDGQKSLKKIIQTSIMDQVSLKLQSDNRAKQVGAIFQLLQLERLSVANNMIRVLPGSISCFLYLNSLNMHNNRLVSIPPDIGLCTNLTHLVLSYNAIAGVPREIGSLKKLRNLDVANNEIAHLPNELGSLTNLEILDVKNNRIVFLPVEMEALSGSLQTLQVDGNDIKDPPLEIVQQGREVLFSYFRHVYNSKRSRDLVLIDMRLRRINMNFAELTVLTALELSGNMISELPAAVLLLTNLTILKAPGNNLVRLVESGDLSPLSNLIYLNIRDNCLPCLEPSISSLNSLREVDFRQNRLESVIPVIQHCSSLKKLVLAQNQLEQVPRNLFKISELAYLSVSHNALAQLPNAICYAVNLLELDFSFNRLQLLPSEFGNLGLLSYLNLNHNVLRELPSSFKRCTALKQLYLNNNALSVLPSEIRRLKNLEELHIRNNLLFSISPDIRYLQNLKTLALDGNQFLTAPSVLKDMASLREVQINSQQTLALESVDGDVTPALSLVDWCENAVIHRKIPRLHVANGIETMSGYLGRLQLPCNAPAVDLTHMQLKTIPVELFTMSMLTLLDLKDNEIEDLPQSILLLTKLRHLDLSTNRLCTLIQEIGCLTALVWLSLAKNHITSLPESMALMQSLRFVDIHVNELRTVLPFSQESLGPSSADSSVAERKSVPSADRSCLSMVSRSDITPCDLGLAAVTSVRDLEISYNKLRTVPNLRAMQHVRRMNLSHNLLEDIDELCHLHSLEKLEAGDNRIRVIPDAISNLTMLSVLSLKNNSLKVIPPELCKCTSLKYLSLNANDLIGLPEGITSLTKLARLTVAANDIVSLPWHLNQMVSLGYLDVSHNPLTLIPPSLGALGDHLKSLVLLDCTGLRDPPENIVEGGHELMMNYLRKVWRGFCTQRMVLTGLNMGKIVCLSHADLSNLVEIRLDKNEIKIIPPTIGSFPNLVSLRFRDNFVADLPMETTNLVRLQELDLSKNKFRTMPQAVLRLTHLIRLRCGGNPIPYTLPAEWIEQDVGHFLTQYVLDTTGKRVAAMFMNNHASEYLAAWHDYVLRRRNQASH